MTIVLILKFIFVTKGFVINGKSLLPSLIMTYQNKSFTEYNLRLVMYLFGKLGKL
jgi:hypothetical protein